MTTRAIPEVDLSPSALKAARMMVAAMLELRDLRGLGSAKTEARRCQAAAITASISSLVIMARPVLQAVMVLFPPKTRKARR